MKLTTKYLIFLPLMIIIITDNIEAIKCFECKSGNDNCNNPFRSSRSGIKKCSGNYCLKSVAKFLGQKATERACALNVKFESGCKHDKIRGADSVVCVCSTDFCNSSTRSKLSVGMLFFVALTIFSLGRDNNIFTCSQG